MPATAIPPQPRLVRLLSVAAVVILLLGGGWVTGALITNDFILSMVLTAAWVGAVGLACLLLFRRRREMWPALAAFLVTAAAAGIYLGSQTLLDQRVDEDVVMARAPARSAAPARANRRAKRPPAPANVLLAKGSFRSLEHETTGVAQAIEVRGGDRVLTLTHFQTSNGPDLRVYLSTGSVSQGSSGEAFRELGKLKGNIGEQQYEIPRGLDLDRFSTVLVWCRAFSAGFGAAPLRGA